MTIDITIGKLVFDEEFFKEELKETLKMNYLNYKTTNSLISFS